MANHETEPAAAAAVPQVLLQLVARDGGVEIQTRMAPAEAFSALLATTMAVGSQLGLRLDWTRAGEVTTAGGIVLPGPGRR